MLSNQSVYTVDVIGDTGVGSGAAGDIAYVVGLANLNSNPAGSLIEFSPSVFGTPQTISLAQQIDLTNVVGPEIIEGPGSGNLAFNGANISYPYLGAIQVGKGVTAGLAGLTISGAGQGGALPSVGCGIVNHGNLALDGCNITSNWSSSSGSEGGGGIENDGTLSLSGSTVSDNSCFGGGPGGGIYNSGTLTLSDSTISQNSSAESGGGIYNVGTLTLTGSTVSGNTCLSSGLGGGIYNRGALTISSSTVEVNESAESGGGIYNVGTLTLTASTVSGNSSSVNGGGIANVGTLTATDTTIADNTACNSYTPLSDGFRNATFGGGVENDGVTQLVGCTVAFNKAFDGAGLFNDSDSLSLISCTVAFNSAIDAASSSGPVAGSGAGVYAYTASPPPARIISSAPVVLENTIVAQNLYGGVHGDLNENLATSPGASFSASSAYNLIGPGNTGMGVLQNGVNRNQVGVANPGLQSLGSFGGPTQTMALEPGSPAIDAGSIALDAGQQVDGRGPGYPRVIGGAVDIGADEFTYQAPPPIVSRFAVLWGSKDASVLTSERNGNLLPQGRSTDLPWADINRIQVEFSEPIVLSSADVHIQSARGKSYGPITTSGISDVATIMLARPIDKADRVTIVIDIPGGKPFSGTLNVLPGDVNGDGVVNSKDLAAIHKQQNIYLGSGTGVYQDINGDGTANGSDSRWVQSFLGTALPRAVARRMRADVLVDQVRLHSTR